MSTIQGNTPGCVPEEPTIKFPFAPMEFKPAESITVTDDNSSVDSPDTLADAPTIDSSDRIQDRETKENSFVSFPTFHPPKVSGELLVSTTDKGAQDRSPSIAASRGSFVDRMSTRRLSHIVQGVVSKDKMKKDDADVARNLLALLFGGLNLLAYYIIKDKDDEYESPLGSNVHATLVTSLALIGVSSRLSDASVYGERLLIAMACSVVLMVSISTMLFFTSPCVHCAYFSTSSAVESSEFTILEPADHEWKFWHLLLGKDVDVKEDVETVACRKCVSNMVVVLYGGLQDYLMKRIGIQPESKVPKYFEELKVEEEFLQDDAGDLAAWYVHYANQTRSEDLKIFNSKIAAALEANGYLGGEALTDAMLGYLCSPASRYDNPDPVKYLNNLKTPRFAGETGSANLTTASLQRIMRGDILKELGVAVCFMLRFALAVPEDHQLETTPIKHTTISPSLNENGMKSLDIRAELPGVMMPQLDQDIDPKGHEIARFRKIMGVFTQLPFEDKVLYFDSQEEYLAFFRWELEKSIQDPFYFPRWLMDGPKRDIVADLLAKKTKYSNDHLVLQDPNADKTMSDRIFFGQGQRLLTPIRIPGFDEDYEFFFPHTSESFLTDEHREMFRYTNKPSQRQLLNMVKHFYPDEVNENSTMLEWRDKILQIDFAALESLPPREGFYPFGCLLYIDVKSRMPMGIWISGRRRLFLPNEGRDWEHAKFFWRINERGALTGRHVAENHFGWSHSVATAAWQTLPSDHGLRTLVKPFTLAVHSINSAAYNMLVREHSILTHGSELTTDGVAASFHIVYNQLNYSETIPDMIDSFGLDGILNTTEMPMWSQGRRLYDAHRKFVGKYISVMYATDEEMMKDDDLHRFWHHVNTQGRHTDPCVCGMDTELFFDDTGKWPAFETKHTCQELLDSANFSPDLNLISRRRQWCEETQPFDRIKALYAVLEKDCANTKDCTMRYNAYTMKDNMGLTPLKTRAQLADFVATFMWHVSAGHEVNGDNIPYFTDPAHSGVRLRDKDENGELPLRVDVGTYVFGLSIGALTTVRCYPLLADWSPLYSHFASSQKHLSSKERHDLMKTLDELHLEYKYELVDLANTFFDETIALPNNQRWYGMNPFKQASSVSV